jgi:hypothetical protein
LDGPWKTINRVIKGGVDTYELPATERDSPRDCRIGFLSAPVVNESLRLGKLVCIVFQELRGGVGDNLPARNVVGSTTKNSNDAPIGVCDRDRESI